MRESRSRESKRMAKRRGRAKSGRLTGWVAPRPLRCEILEDRRLLTNILGIDVSGTSQPNIYWPQVAATGTSFAFVKATQGDSFQDSKFSARMPLAAESLNSNVSAYHFADPNEHNDHLLDPSLPFTDPNDPSSVANDAISEADQFVEVAGPYLTAPYLQPALDLEDDEGGGGFITSSASSKVPGAPVWTWSEIAYWVDAWTARVQTQVPGVKPILYMTRSWAANLQQYLNNSNYELWVAVATTASEPEIPPPGWGAWSPSTWPWAIEQYNTETGRVLGVGGPGINGRVDLDAMNPSISLDSLRIGPLTTPLTPSQQSGLLNGLQGMSQWTQQFLGYGAFGQRMTFVVDPADAVPRSVTVLQDRQVPLAAASQGPQLPVAANSVGEVANVSTALQGLHDQLQALLPASSSTPATPDQIVAALSSIHDATVDGFTISIDSVTASQSYGAPLLFTVDLRREDAGQVLEHEFPRRCQPGEFHRIDQRQSPRKPGFHLYVRHRRKPQSHARADVLVPGRQPHGTGSDRARRNRH